MLVGVLSDTHDNVEQVEKAGKLFEERRVNAIIHCGDFITPIVLDTLSRLSVAFFGVFGNNDYKEALSSRSRAQIKDEPYRFELGGRKFFICHHRRYIEQLEDNHQEIDIALYGETHEPEIRQDGKCLIVNPGETCGWVTGFSTVAVIDLDNLSAEIVQLNM